MTRALARRIARLEAAKSPVRRYSGRVEVGVFETCEQAVARHREAYGLPPRGHGLFIVPAKPTNAAEEAECLHQFKDQQLRLIDAAKHDRLASAPLVPVASPFPVGIKPAVPFGFNVTPWVGN